VVKGTGTQSQLTHAAVPCAFFLLRQMKNGNVKIFIKKMRKENSHKDTKSQRYTKKLYKNPWCLSALVAKKIKEGT